MDAGINTGDCIFGDADCDGNPSTPSQALIDIGGNDVPLLAGSEFFYIMLDFSFNLNHPAYRVAAAADWPKIANTTIIVGKPGNGNGGFSASAVDNYVKGTPSLDAAWGGNIPGTTVSIYNYDSSINPDPIVDPRCIDVTQPIGPTVGKPHLELSIAGFSNMVQPFPGNTLTGLLHQPVNWLANKDIACVAVWGGAGSNEDGPTIGEGSTLPRNFCPTPSPSVSPSPSESPSESPSSSLTASESPSPSESPSAVPLSACGTRPSEDNTRPTFVKKVHNTQKADPIEVRLCVHSATAHSNVGLAQMLLETSLDGMCSFKLSWAGQGHVPTRCMADNAGRDRDGWTVLLRKESDPYDNLVELRCGVHEDR